MIVLGKGEEGMGRAGKEYFRGLDIERARPWKNVGVWIVVHFESWCPQR